MNNTPNSSLKAVTLSLLLCINTTLVACENQKRVGEILDCTNNPIEGQINLWQKVINNYKLWDEVLVLYNSVECGSFVVIPTNYTQEMSNYKKYEYIWKDNNNLEWKEWKAWEILIAPYSEKPISTDFFYKVDIL